MDTTSEGFAGLPYDRQPFAGLPPGYSRVTLYCSRCSGPVDVTIPSGATVVFSHVFKVLLRMRGLTVAPHHQCTGASADTVPFGERR